MNLVERLFASLVAGFVVLIVVGVAVTALLEPYVWLSLMVGAPAGIVSGVATAVLLYAWLTARDERRRTGTVSPGTQTLVAGSVGGVVGFVVVGTLAAATVFFLGFGLASAMLFVGLPVGILASALGAAAAVVYGRRREGMPGPAAQ